MLLLGCAHAGVANTLDHLRVLTGKNSTLAVVGGLHLSAAPEARIQSTLRALQKANVQRVAPVHCTGPTATAALQEAYGDAGQPLRVGDSLEFNATP